MINQTLNNRYHLTALLGEGAMGEVYRAADTQTGQEVAVKVITQDLAFDHEMLESFRFNLTNARNQNPSPASAFPYAPPTP